MNKAELFHQKVMEELKSYTTKKVDRFFQHLNDTGDGRDRDYFTEIYRKTGPFCWYYQYLACAVRVLQAKQAVELGADRGASALMMASEMPDGMVYSVDDGSGFDKKDLWSYIPKDVKNIVKLLGDSVDMKLWQGVDLKKTDLWLYDSEHTAKRVKKEIKAYSPYWKKGAVVIFDDLRYYKEVWDSLTCDKFYSPHEIHGFEVGVCAI